MPRKITALKRVISRHSNLSGEAKHTLWSTETPHSMGISRIGGAIGLAVGWMGGPTSRTPILTTVAARGAHSSTPRYKRLLFF